MTNTSTNTTTTPQAPQTQNNIRPWIYELATKSTFSIWDYKYFIQPKYWFRLVRIKPTFKHISKLKKEWNNLYLFDVIDDNKNKTFYELELLDNKAVIR